MKPPRAYARGILHFFGAIRRSTLLAYSAEAAASAGKAGRSALWSRVSLEALVSTVVSAPRGEPSFGRSPLAFIHGLTSMVFCKGG